MYMSVSVIKTVWLIFHFFQVGNSTTIMTEYFLYYGGVEGTGPGRGGALWGTWRCQVQ